MQINPFNQPLVEMENARKAATQRIAELSRLLDWYSKFDVDVAHTRRLGLERKLATNVVLTNNLKTQLQQLRAAKVAADEKASVGMDPRTWLSAERAIAKRKVTSLNNEIAQLHAKMLTLASAKTESGEDVRTTLNGLQQDLEHYRHFHALQAQSEIAMRETELVQLEPQLERLRERKLRLDAELAGPWQRLEARRASRATIEKDMRKAEQFSAALNTEHGNKAAIHRACERELGDGSPGRIKSQLKQKLELEVREIAKLEERIAESVRKCQRDVRAVILDGSNMAHHGGAFIGLKAIEAIMPRLVSKCAVTINFDPGFGRRVGLSSAQIRARFPGVHVHFVPRGMKADPFVLKFVEDKPYAYVISNDNFRDFSEKQAVQQGRILKHAILNGMACIPALDLEEPFTEG